MDTLTVLTCLESPAEGRLDTSILPDSIVSLNTCWTPCQGRDHLWQGGPSMAAMFGLRNQLFFYWQFMGIISEEGPSMAWQH